MFCFVETDIREQKKYETRIQTSVDKTVNDLRYEIKFENRVNDKNNSFIKQNTDLLFWTKIYYILGDIFFKISKNLISSTFFFCKADTKKHRYASTKASNAALVKLTGWIIKNDHVIKSALFFWSDKHGETRNVIWLCTTWLLIFWQEVANKKPLFTRLAIVHELKLSIKKI